MKKLLSMLLVLLFVFAHFAGCAAEKPEDAGAGGTGAPSGGSEAPAGGAEAPAGGVEAPAGGTEAPPAGGEAAGGEAAGGNGELVAFVVPSLAPPALNSIVTMWSEELAAAGYNPQAASAELDVAQFIPLIENYTTMQAALICVSPMDPAGVEDVVTAARNQGIFVTMLSAQPTYEIDGGLTTDYYATGVVAASMLLDYLHTAYPDAAPDSIPVAVSTNNGLAEAVLRSQGYTDTIDADPIAYIGYEQEVLNNTPEEGFNFTQSALTTNPDIRMFLMYDTNLLPGVNNYIIAMPDVDLSEFCVVGTGTMDDEVATLIELSKTDEAVVRGLCQYGGDTPGLTLATVALKLLSGEVESPYWEYDAITTVNTFDFVYEG